MTFDEFCRQRGISSTPPDFPELHRTPREPSKHTKRSTDKRVIAALDTWAADRERLRVEYDALLQSGEIIPLSRLERLQQIASGHPDRADVQAAKRLLTKTIK
jgi:hypothetical protein